MKTISMKGKEVDFSVLIAKNEQQIALGNGSMNARGDIVGRSGVILKRRDQIAAEYYANPPQAVRQVSLKDIASEEFMTPAQAIKAVEAVSPETDITRLASRPTKRKMKETDD